MYLYIEVIVGLLCVGDIIYYSRSERYGEWVDYTLCKLVNCSVGSILYV